MDLRSAGAFIRVSNDGLTEELSHRAGCEQWHGDSQFNEWWEEVPQRLHENRWTLYGGFLKMGHIQKLTSLVLNLWYPHFRKPPYWFILDLVESTRLGKLDRTYSLELYSHWTFGITTEFGRMGAPQLVLALVPPFSIFGEHFTIPQPSQKGPAICRRKMQKVIVTVTVPLSSIINVINPSLSITGTWCMSRGKPSRELPSQVLLTRCLVPSGGLW